MHTFLSTLMMLMFALTSSGQHQRQKQMYILEYPWCEASPEIIKEFIPPPPEFLSPLKSAGKRSEFIITYQNFPPDAKVAFEYAASIWESLLESPVPIYIEANWTSAEGNVLGSCGPYDYRKNFDGAPHKDIYYPIALAEKIQGVELTGAERPDMIAEFNEDVNWYFGTDGDTPTNMYDFVSVVLHEIAHGIGFTGFFYVQDQTGGYIMVDWGDATSFDQLVLNQTGEQLIDTSHFENPSMELRDQLTSGYLIAYSPSAMASDPDSEPRLYAPFRWNSGSSIYHLNSSSYPSGNENNLMTHAMGRGQATHHPGPVTLGILADIGWKNLKIEHVPLFDMEEVKPLTFEVQFFSDYPLDASRLHVVYSTDAFATHIDSVVLQYDSQALYSATLEVDENSQYINYYISATDSLDRTFTKPAGAPEDFFTVNFGPDHIAPAIQHDPIELYLTTSSPLVVNAQVSDNMGIDNVYVEYAVNGIRRLPFELSPISANTYAGFFPLNRNLINDGDEITYNIVAVDASAANNTSRFPNQGEISFEIEKISDPVSFYSNDFDDDSNRDFTSNDFSIYTAPRFENAALHSPHPYPSTLDTDTDYNFTTVLKHPIILNEKATMRFDEIVLVEPGDSGSIYGDFSFWDYVIVEGSKDKGENWLPVIDGYDSRAHDAWKNSYYSSIAGMNSITAGSPALYITRHIDILNSDHFNVKDTVLFRFRLYSDPFANGWGWAIDNLEIQIPATTTVSVPAPQNITVYPNPFHGSFKLMVNNAHPIELLQVEIYTIHGHKIKTVEFRNTTPNITAEISMDNKIPGIYLLLIKENGKQVLSKKIIHN